jgi:hypothetical protein
MGNAVKVKVVSETPGADAGVDVMFDSTVTFGVSIDGDSRNQTLNAHGVSRVVFTLKNSHLGTLKAYESMDKGANWVQVGGDISVAAAAATDVNGPYDFLVDAYDDFRLTWTNGGSAQTTWRPGVQLIIGDRASGT